MIDIVIVICITIVMLVKIYFVHRCEHEYEIIDTINVKDNGKIVSYKYVNRCKKCGKIKIKTT
ncbi:MAG: hypothetical protein ACRCXT_16135 [Paraclostridium sp.]